MAGRVLLVPNLLGLVAPDAVLPRATIDAARSLTHWAVETPKAARAFLATLALSTPLRELSIEPIGESPDGARLAELLAPAERGSDLGVLSDAGCPGIADPGALLVAAAHAKGLPVIPLTGPSSILLALMGSGMGGQRFAFHGYLPVAAPARAKALRDLEARSRTRQSTEIFIETPYRNVAMLETILATLGEGTRLCVAADLTLATQSIVSRRIAQWRAGARQDYAKRPAVFLIAAG